MKNKIKFTFVVATMIMAFAACRFSTSETSDTTQEDSISNDSTIIIPSDTTVTESLQDSSAIEKR